MNDTPKSKKMKPENTVKSMFEKKFKAMEMASATFPNETQGSDGEFSSSASQSQGVGMESDSSNDDKMLSADNGQPQPVKCDQVVETEYDACLAMSIHVLRFLSRLGMEWTFKADGWGWDFLCNNENFNELVNFVATYKQGFQKAVSENPMEFHKLMTHEASKNLVSACAKVTAKFIVQDIGDDYFGIIVDGTYDKFSEDHLSLYLRYVDKKGLVIERLLGIVHVDDFTPVTCKAAIDSLLLEYSLSPCKIRGQSFNRNSNMATYLNSDINGNKTLIVKEYQCAYHSYCFSHHLHLALVNAAEKSDDVCRVFMKLADYVNVVKGSCSREEMLQETKVQKVLEALGTCVLENRKYWIYDFGSQKLCDNWEYDHYKTLLHVITLFPTIVEVLDMIAEILRVEYLWKAGNIANSFFTFEFVFVAHLMMAIFGYTEGLHHALQRTDRDIVNVLSLVSTVKNKFQTMRSDHEWEKLVNEVSSFCVRNEIEVLDMSAKYEPFGISKRFVKPSTNLGHFRDDVYFSVIDLQLLELNNLFDETSMELLSCMACLNPADSFSSFDKKKLIRFTEFYPGDFSAVDLKRLEFQLDIFIADMRNDDRFKNLKDLGQLSAKLVETKKHVLYSNVYLLLRLMLILPVATPSIERTITAMDHVKYKLLYNVGDQLLYNCLTTYVEREVFSQVLDDDVISCYKTMTITQESQD